MPKSFAGKRTTNPLASAEKMPDGPDNRYFPFHFAHPTQSWECKPDPSWKPSGKGPQEASRGAAAWGVGDDCPWVWLPRLKTFARQPGVNGVRLGKKGGGAPEIKGAMLHATEEFGMVAIPFDSYPGGYLVEYATGHAGQKAVVYADVWTEIQTIPGKGGKQTKHVFNGANCPAHTDGIPFDQWRASLVTRGIVEPPSQIAMDAAIGLQSARASRHEKKESTNPVYALHGTKERYKLDKMRETSAPVVKGKKEKAA